MDSYIITNSGALTVVAPSTIVQYVSAGITSISTLAAPLPVTGNAISTQRETTTLTVRETPEVSVDTIYVTRVVTQTAIDTTFRTAGSGDATCTGSGAERQGVVW